MNWTREYGDYVSGDYLIRKYEDRYNLRRLSVVRGYKLFHEGVRIGEAELLRDAKRMAEDHSRTLEGAGR